MPSKKSAGIPASATLLVELLTEELPPRALKRLSEAFAEALVAELRDAEQWEIRRPPARRGRVPGGNAPPIGPAGGSPLERPVVGMVTPVVLAAIAPIW